jgi:hypothetical protein
MTDERAQREVQLNMAGHTVDEVIAACLVADSAVLTGVKGRLMELLNHPRFTDIKRVELHEFFDLAPEDLEALRRRSNLSPIAVIGIGDDGPSVQAIIELLNVMSMPAGIEKLILYWDTYLEDNIALIRQREAEVNQLLGRNICRVDPSN